MGLGIGWILAVADVVAAWPNAVRYIPQPEPAVLPLIVLGALLVMLWQGRGRWAGLAPMLAALAFWLQTERPLLLVSADGGLVGASTAEGRALSRARGQGFVAQSWLENDGNDRDREAAYVRAARLGAEIPGGFALPLGASAVAALFSPDQDEIDAACAAFPLTFTNRTPADALPPGCHLLGPDWLERTGGIAVMVGGQSRAWRAPALFGVMSSRMLQPDDLAAEQVAPPAFRVATVRAAHGRRLWNDRATRRAEPSWETAWLPAANAADQDRYDAGLARAVAALSTIPLTRTDTDAVPSIPARLAQTSRETTGQ
jgi:hypothetical protein